MNYSCVPDAKPFALFEHHCGDRHGVEQFIASRFNHSFAAHIDAFMPRLLSLRNRQGAIVGAFGLRGSSRRLFLEQYLDAPIETEIARCARAPVERDKIIEVGQLCGDFPGAARVLIARLTMRLHCNGYQWVAFTGTRALCNAFMRIGMHPIELRAASALRIPVPERASWGSYYAHSPHVFAGRIEDGVRALTQAALATRDDIGFAA